MKSKFLGGLIFNPNPVFDFTDRPTASPPEISICGAERSANPGTISQPPLGTSPPSPAQCQEPLLDARRNLQLFINDDHRTRAATAPTPEEYLRLRQRKTSPELFRPGFRLLQPPGLQIFGHYWHVRGLEVAYAGDNSIFISGNYNIVKIVSFHDNRDTGLRLGRYSSSASRSEWPSYGLIPRGIYS